MNRSRLMRVFVFFAALASSTATNAGWSYPIYPVGQTVVLDPVNDFLVSAPINSNPNLTPPIGDDYSRHPGWNAGGLGQPGDYFIGLFSHEIDVKGKLYLWETTGAADPVAFPGPAISVGFWDGTDFHQEGISLFASYHFTGQFNQNNGFGVYSSITPLGDFGIIHGPLNAVRVEATRFGHNQLTAVATAVPEPCSMVLLGSGLLSFIGYGWLRSSRRESVVIAAQGGVRRFAREGGTTARHYPP